MNSKEFVVPPGVTVFPWDLAKKRFTISDIITGRIQYAGTRAETQAILDEIAEARSPKAEVESDQNPSQ